MMNEIKKNDYAAAKMRTNVGNLIFDIIIYLVLAFVVIATVYPFWNTIVYLGAMTAIDPCLYEAAQIDGCGRLRKIWHITLPGIKATIIIMMIMSAGHILDANFEMPYLLQNGMIQDVAETIDIYVLKYGFKLSRYGLATAAGIFKNAVNILLLLLANTIAKKSGEERLI